MEVSTKHIALILSLTLVIIPAFAQGAPPATPIDGGISLLVVAGGIYGVKKLRDQIR